MKTPNIVSVLAVLLVGLLLFPIVQEKVWAIKRDRVSSKIKASYMQAALRGDVALPATNSDALRCWSVCFWSLPHSVEVRTSFGTRFFYIAQRTTNSVSPYNFRFITGTDVNGNQLTNTPGI